jgi:quinol monooxygenase YgiN
MKQYLLQGKLIAKPGSLDELTQIMLEASKLMLAKAKGCKLYVVGHSGKDDNTIFITEIWETKEDHDSSLEVPGVKELISKAMPILSQMPTKGEEIIILN